MAVLHTEQVAKSSSPSPEELRRILHLQVPVIVKLAERKMTVEQVISLGAGSMIELAKGGSEPLELLINNKVIGHGEVVKVGDHFGLRITQIGDVKQIIQSMGT